MYKFVTKGIVVGAQLTRRALRYPLSILGKPFDYLFATLSGDGKEYWKKNNDWFYPDNTTGHPGEIAFGYLGDIPGVVVGGIAGGIVGGALFFPDLVLSRVSQRYTNLKEALDQFAEAVGDRDKFISISKPNNYFEKAFNLSSGTLGYVLGLAFSKIVGGITFLVTDSPRASNVAGKAGGILGGVIGTFVAIPLLPVKHLLNRAQVFYEGFRNSVRNGVAWIYAYTNTKPDQPSKGTPQDCCAPPLHDPEFIEAVKKAKETSTATMFLGALKPELQTKKPDTEAKGEAKYPPPPPTAPLTPVFAAAGEPSARRLGGKVG